MSNAVLQGSLSSFRLPEVLTFLSSTRKSGTLTLAAGDGNESYVFFEGGSLIYAGSNQESFRLAAILLRKHKISRAQCELIDDLMRREGGRFGQIAVQQGVLTESQLRDFLKIQVSEILYEAFVWVGGTFAFSEEKNLPNYAVTISVDLANLIMEGARRIDEWEQCVRLLPDKNVVFRVVSNPEKEDKITLSRDEWKILFLVNGQRTLDELCREAEEEPFHVYRVVYGLYANQLIERVSQEPMAEEEKTGRTASLDSTMKQAEPVFHAESTVREKPDDTSLLISAEAKLSYHEVVRPTVAQLTIVSGEMHDTVFPLAEPEYLLGRQRDNQLQLNDLGVSGFHARIFRGADGYVLEDLKSRNGTWLNGTRIFHAVLKNGDRIRLGSTEMEYSVLYEPTTVPAAEPG